jgi:hypothetical protein
MQMVFENYIDFEEVVNYLTKNQYNFYSKYENGKYFIKIEY